MIYVDAGNKVVGRLASSVAKMLLSGESVTIVNAEKAVIMGRPKATIGIYRQKRARGDPYHGPFYPKRPDMLIKRIVRGMLPYKTARGREAFKRLKVFISIPSEMKDQRFSDISGTGNKGEHKSIRLKVLSERI